MSFLKNNWFWLALVLFLLIALWTANRTLMFLIGIAATAYLIFQKITNPVYWALAALAWLWGLFWNNPTVVAISNALTPNTNPDRYSNPNFGSSGGTGTGGPASLG